MYIPESTIAEACTSCKSGDTIYLLQKGLFLHRLNVFQDVFTYIKGEWRERAGEREREIIYLTVHSPNDPQSRGWTRLKPKARNLIPISHVSNRNSST